MSMLSEPAIFVIADPSLNESPKPKEIPNALPPKLTVTTPENSPSETKKTPKQNGQGGVITINYAPPPITEFKKSVLDGNTLKIEWVGDEHASDYHIFWDKGKGGEFVKLTPTTKGLNHFTLDNKNSGGIIGSDSFNQNGGTFYFKISYSD